MDEIDRHILATMQENARISVTELGKLIGLSTPAANVETFRGKRRHHGLSGNHQS